MARAAVQRRLTWRLGRVTRRIDETARAKTLVLGVPDWPGHFAGQHVDVRLTAPDGYQAERSYSIASAPEDGEQVTLTVERIEDGEVSPYLVDELAEGDQLELRGPIGGYFVWSADMGGPLIPVAVAFTPVQQPLCMVCGPTPLVDAVASTLVELDHPPDRVKTERFGPTGG